VIVFNVQRCSQYKYPRSIHSLEAYDFDVFDYIIVCEVIAPEVLPTGSVLISASTTST
jgi:hypothetical protein